jgi:hypothetical protein
MMYANGEGVPQDYSEAYFWLNLAAALTSDDPEPARYREVVEAKLSPAVLLPIQKRCREWMEAYQARRSRHSEEE